MTPTTFPQELIDLGWPCRWQNWPRGGEESAWEVRKTAAARSSPRRRTTAKPGSAIGTWCPATPIGSTIEHAKQLPAGRGRAARAADRRLYAYNTAAREQADRQLGGLDLGGGR